MAVEKGYFESLDDLLAQKTDLQLSLPEVCLYIYITVEMFYDGPLSNF